MPTYEYRCPEGHEFDVFQRMSDEPGATCPTCGADAERLISAGAGLIFKGSGFYITDSRSPEYTKKASAEKGTSQAGGQKEAAGESASGSSVGDGAGGVSEPRPSATEPSPKASPGESSSGNGSSGD